MKNEETKHDCCGGDAHGDATTQTAIDPVCGMTVTPNDDTPTHEHDGETYYFCCAGCRGKFADNPGAFLKTRDDAEADGSCCGDHASHKKKTKAESDRPADPDAMYTCPMHPEIEQRGPGDCPKCGMALEPMDAGAEVDDSEVRDMTRRFWIALALTLPVFVVAMSDMVPGVALTAIAPASVWGWLQAALCTPVVFWCGSIFWTRAWRSVVNVSPNMFTLIALGTGVAWVYSVVALLAPGVFPESMRGEGGHVALYFESAAVIVTLVLLGQMLEARARHRTGSALRELLDLTPPTARRVTESGDDEEVSLDEVGEGDRLRVRPGDKVPVDGTIVEGNGTLDESMVTGEPTPVQKSSGDDVTGGTVNKSGGFVMEATRVGDDTVLSRIVQMVAEAQRSRAPVQDLADKVAAWFVPSVLAIALIAFVAWASIGDLTFAIVAAVSVLIIACPCALGLATPMSIMVGMGRGAHAGVLFKDATALQLLERIDTVVVDKTGTLTEGRPKLVAVEALEDLGESELLRLAAGLERGSEHPLAEAIIAGARERDIDLPDSSDFESTTGKGVSGTVEGRRVALGNVKMLNMLDLDAGPAGDRAEQLRGDGDTVVFVVVDGKVVGLLGVADPIKDTTREAIGLLHDDDIDIVMLTGDNETTARAVARELRIDRVEAEGLPEQKQDHVKALRERDAQPRDGRRYAARAR